MKRISKSSTALSFLTIIIILVVVVSLAYFLSNSRSPTRQVAPNVPVQNDNIIASQTPAPITQKVTKPAQSAVAPTVQNRVQSSVASPLVVTAPPAGYVWQSGGSYRINWLTSFKDGYVGIYFRNKSDGRDCLLGSGPVITQTFTLSITLGQDCPYENGLKLFSGKYSFFLKYPFSPIDWWSGMAGSVNYGDASGALVPVTFQ